MSNQTELLREAADIIDKLADDLMNELADRYPAESRKFPSQNRRYERDVAIVNEARAFLAKIDAAEGEESEFQVISGADEDACIEAATSGPRDVALREAMRYAHQYAEDGPVKVVELVTVAMLPAARRQESE